MEISDKTIKSALILHGYADIRLNVMTMQDALAWEDREDYNTLSDMLDSVMEDESTQLMRR